LVLVFWQLKILKGVHRVNYIDVSVPAAHGYIGVLFVSKLTDVFAWFADLTMMTPDTFP
jgi:hypothetical protein